MREKALGEVSSDIFRMVNQTKKQQNGVFFKLFWQGLYVQVCYQGMF